MQLTTREAVEEAIKCIEYCMHGYNTIEVDASKKERLKNSAQLLCDHYGFKPSQFFDVEEA